MCIRLNRLGSGLLLVLAGCLSATPLRSAPPVTPSNQIIKIDWKEQGKAVNGSWEARYKNTFRLSSMWNGTIGGGASIGGKMVLVGAGMSSPEGLYKLRGSLLGLKPGDMLQYYLSESVGTGTETVGSPPTTVPMREGLTRDGMFTLSIRDKTFLEGDSAFRKDQGVPLNENFPNIGRAYSRAIDVKRTKDGIEVLLGMSNFTLPYSPHGPNFPEDDCSQAEGTQEKVFHDLQSFKFTTAELQNPGKITKSRMSSNSVEGDTYSANVTVTITEEEDEVEVAVEPQSDYLSWLPKGNMENPTKPGNEFKVSIQVHKKGDPSKPRRANLQILLPSVSKNKGVCLNWPQNGQVGEGLRFRSEDYPAGGQVVWKSSTRLESREAVESADIVLKCYDFGAWGNLIVEAKDERGRAAKVRVRGKETEELAIPLDENQNHIADSWEKNKPWWGKAGASDEEEIAGQDAKGDGITLYNEYRGMVLLENGARMWKRLDPAQKEMFILDPGQDFPIALWKRISSFQAYRLDESMVDASSNAGRSPLVNFNSSDSSGHPFFALKVRKIGGDEDPDPARDGEYTQPKSTTDPSFPLMAYAFSPSPGIKGTEYIKVFPQRALTFVTYYTNWLEMGLKDPDSQAGRELRDPQNQFSVGDATQALAVMRTPAGQKEVMRKVLNVLFLHESGHVVADLPHHTGDAPNDEIRSCLMFVRGASGKRRMVVLSAIGRGDPEFAYPYSGFCKTDSGCSTKLNVKDW